MAGVTIQFAPTVFDPGQPMAGFAGQRHKAVWDLCSGVESGPHIDCNFVKSGRGEGVPNSITIKVRYGSPSWLDTVLEFNSLPYPEIRAQIANAVERGILVVSTATGGAFAVGSITATPKANLIDGETVTIPDAGGTIYTYHFDVSGTYVPGGGYDATNLRVNISGDTTANEVATTLAAVINGVFTAPAPAANIIAVTQTAGGAVGNRPMANTVANVNFITEGFGGGGAAAVADIRDGTVV